MLTFINLAARTITIYRLHCSELSQFTDIAVHQFIDVALTTGLGNSEHRFMTEKLGLN